MIKGLRWTSQDLEALPDDGTRYEIVDGELYMSKQPNWNHQGICNLLSHFLTNWNRQVRSGQIRPAPGIIFDDENNVAPDVIWISNQRLATSLESDGKLHAAPELVIEVLSPGSTNEIRDREVKRKLYSRRGVNEYWVISWQKKQVEVYRRPPDQPSLELEATLYENDSLKSPLLPGFACLVSEIFEEVV